MRTPSLALKRGLSNDDVLYAPFEWPCARGTPTWAAILSWSERVASICGGGPWRSLSWGLGL